MTIKQLSVFIENKAGRLAEITGVLREHHIDIRAVSIADTKDFGILRLIVTRPDEAEAALRAAGMTVSLTEVIAIGVEDQPGALSDALTILQNNGITIDYMYAYISRTDDLAYVILRVEDNARAVEVMNQNHIRVLDGDEVYAV